MTAFINVALLYLGLLMIHIIVLYLGLLVIDIIVYMKGEKCHTIWLDRHGYPLEFIKGRWFINFIRWRNFVSMRMTGENPQGWWRNGLGLFPGNVPKPSELRNIFL